MGILSSPDYFLPLDFLDILVDATATSCANGFVYVRHEKLLSFNPPR
jgi:hypothetical protein